MTGRQEIQGVVVHRGAGQRDPRPDCYLVDELVFKDTQGQLIRLADVVVPAGAYGMLHQGASGRFDILYLIYPKPMGNYDRTFVVDVRTAEGTANGADSIHRWVQSSKGAAFHFFWYGFLLLPAFGFGLLLWVCALRLIALEVPQLANRAKGTS